MKSPEIYRLAFEAIKVLGESTKRQISDYVLDRLVELGKLPYHEPHQRPTFHEVISIGFMMTKLKDDGLVLNERRGQDWIWFTTVASKVSSN